MLPPMVSAFFGQLAILLVGMRADRKKGMSCFRDAIS
jgi:hypothetical protein